jgi:hypothetical protein
VVAILATQHGDIFKSTCPQALHDSRRVAQPGSHESFIAADEHPERNWTA